MSSKTDPASFKAFVRAFGGSWVTFMTGPLTLPFTVVAFYVTDETARIIFGILAVGCFATSAYVIWRNERNSHIITEEKLNDLNIPSVSIALHKVDEDYDSIQRIFLEVLGVGVEYVRPEVFAISVEEIGKGNKPLFYAPGDPPPFGVRREEPHNVLAVIHDRTKGVELRIVLPCKKITSSEYLKGDAFRMTVRAFAGPKPAELTFEFGMENGALWARNTGSSEALFSDVRLIARRGDKT